MTKVKYTALIADMRGKLSGSVFSKNKGGAYVKTLVSPTNPNTSPQIGQRGYITTLSQQWRTLTEAQRLSWNQRAGEWQNKDVFGDVKNPSGINLFIGLNSWLLYLGLSVNLTAPLSASPQNVNDLFVICDSSLGLMVVYSTSFASPSGTYWVISATPQVSAGRNFLKNIYKRIYALAPSSFAFPDITSNYFSVLGTTVFTPGAKLAVKCVAVNAISGQASAPVSASCIVDAVPATNWDVDAQNYFARLSFSMPYVLKFFINRWFVKVKADNNVSSIGDLFEFVRFLFVPDGTDCYLNVIRNSFTATPNNPPVHTNYEGVQGDGISMSIIENFNQSTEALVSSQNDYFFGFYSRTDVDEVAVDMGCAITASDKFCQNAPRISGSFYSRNNQGGAPYLSGVISNTLGQRVSVRNGASVHQYWANGVKVGENTDVSNGMPNSSLMSLAQYLDNTSGQYFSTKQHAISFAGKASVVDQLKLYEANQALMASFGKQV